MTTLAIPKSKGLYSVGFDVGLQMQRGTHYGEHMPRREINEQTHLVQVNDGPFYSVDLTYEMKGGRWRLVGIKVSSDLQRVDAYLDVAQLGRIRLGEVIQNGFERLIDPVALRMDPWGLLPDSLVERISDRVRALVQEHGDRPDPRSRPFDHFATISAIYEASVRSGLRPTVQVATWADVSKAAAEKQILRTREFGLLPPPHPGRQQAWIDVEDDEEAQQ